MTPRVTTKYMWVNLTYISCSSDYALYLEDYLMEKCLILDIRSIDSESDLKI